MKHLMFRRALRETGVSGHAMLPALVCFRLGVDAGQLLLMAEVFMCLWLMKNGTCAPPPTRTITVGTSPRRFARRRSRSSDCLQHSASSSLAPRS